MPRMKTIKPALQEQIEWELKSQYGATLSIKNVAEYIGFNRTAAAEWVEGLPFMRTNGEGKRKRYYASAIAEKMYLNTEM